VAQINQKEELERLDAFVKEKIKAFEGLKKAHGAFTRSRRRYQKEQQPILGDLVVFQAISTNDIAASVILLEYDGMDGFILRQDEGNRILKWGELGVGFVRRIDTDIGRRHPDFQLTSRVSSTVYSDGIGILEGGKTS
jgi:hypothetical protein